MSGYDVVTSSPFHFVVLERVTLLYAVGNLFVSHNYALYDATTYHPDLSIVTFVIVS